MTSVTEENTSLPLGGTKTETSKHQDDELMIDRSFTHGPMGLGFKARICGSTGEVLEIVPAVPTEAPVTEVVLCTTAQVEICGAGIARVRIWLPDSYRQEQKRKFQPLG